MASKTLLFLAITFAVVLLIASEVAADKDTASNLDSHADDRGGYGNGEHGGYGRGGGRGGRGGGGGGCRYGCCGRGGGYGRRGCRCCSTFEEATAYKQSQN